MDLGARFSNAQNLVTKCIFNITIGTLYYITNRYDYVCEHFERVTRYYLKKTAPYFILHKECLMEAPNPF